MGAGGGGNGDAAGTCGGVGRDANIRAGAGTSAAVLAAAIELGYFRCACSGAFSSAGSFTGTPTRACCRATSNTRSFTSARDAGVATGE